MTSFFILVAALGALLIGLDLAARTPDSIPVELTGGTPYGIFMMLLGFIGALFNWLLP